MKTKVLAKIEVYRGLLSGEPKLTFITKIQLTTPRDRRADPFLGCWVGTRFSNDPDPQWSIRSGHDLGAYKQSYQATNSQMLMALKTYL